MKGHKKMQNMKITVLAWLALAVLAGSSCRNSECHGWIPSAAPLAPIVVAFSGLTALV